MATRIIEIRVGILRHSSPQQDESFVLSDLDILMPKLYVPMVEIFELSPSAGKDDIVHNLARGLERTLADYPILAGTLHFDNELKRVFVHKKADATLALHVKHAVDTEIPPFNVLDKADFPVHLLDSPKVLPPLFVAEHWNPIPANGTDEIGPAVAGAQITFINGGCILGLAISHQICDAMGFECLFKTWSRHAKSSGTGQVLNGLAESQVETTFSRNILSAKDRTPLSSEQLTQLIDRYPVMKLRDGPPASPPEGFKMPTVKTRIWHFPKSKLGQLKSQCSAGLEAGSWVSTYDSLLALMWRATVRAKFRLLNPAPDAPSRAVHAVNGRGRTDPTIPSRYIGAAITMPVSETLTVAEVLGDLDTTLPKLASAVRASINSVTPAYISDLMRYAAGSPDLRWSELDMHWVLGLDCMAFDWHTMKSYQEHDFGFGTPAAVRWPHPGFEGFFFVLPSRAGVRNAGPDEGLEICFGLEESCFAELEKDEEFARYAEQRGVRI